MRFAVAATLLAAALVLAPAAQASFPGRDGVIVQEVSCFALPRCATARTRLRLFDVRRRRARTVPTCESCGNGNWPAWSPDGRRLVVAADAETSAILTPSGRRVRTIPHSAGGVWSPDGRELLLSRRDGWDRVGLDGRVHRRLIPQAMFVDWSSRNLIAYDRTSNARSGLTSSILTVRPSGRDVRRVTSGLAPSFSPDGRSLAFLRWVRGRFDLWTIPLRHGGRPHRIARGVAGLFPAAWAPDGRSIAFVGSAHGRTSLLVVRPDGRGLRRVASADAEAIGWQPRR